MQNIIFKIIRTFPPEISHNLTLKLLQLSLNQKKIINDPILHQHIFGLDLHLARLQKGLKSIQIQNPYSLSEWRSIIHKVIELNPGDNNQAVYLQITRGCDRDRKHTYGDISPTVYIQSTAFDVRPREELLKGAKVITQDEWIKKLNKTS